MPSDFLLLGVVYKLTFLLLILLLTCDVSHARLEVVGVNVLTMWTELVSLLCLQVGDV